MFAESVFSIALLIMDILSAILPSTTGRIMAMIMKLIDIVIRPLRQVHPLQVLQIYLTAVIAVYCEREQLHMERRQF